MTDTHYQAATPLVGDRGLGGKYLVVKDKKLTLYIRAGSIEITVPFDETETGHLAHYLSYQEIKLPKLVKEK